LLQLLVHPLAPDDEAPLGVARRDAAGPPEAVPINEPYIPQHLTPSLFQPGQAVDDELATVTLNSFRHANPNYFFSDRYEETWRPELRHLLLARIHAQIAPIAETYGLRDPYVIIKEPNGSIGAELIMSLLPRARLMFLLRDGRDVVDSMVDAVSPGSWLEQSFGSGENRFEDHRLAIVRHESVLWRARSEAVQRAYKQHPPQLRQLVRYEDTRANPTEVLAILDKWIGLRRDAKARMNAIRWNDFDAFPAEAKGAGMPLRAARPGLWRENLSGQEQDAMADIMGPKLTELGYEP
jgi:hypothetical protein